MPRQPITEYAVLATDPDHVDWVELVIAAVSEDEARREVEEMGYVVQSIRIEPRRRLRKVAATVGCVLLAAFFVALREVVRWAAGPGLNPLMFLFSWLTLTVATSALAGILLVWLPYHRLTRLVERYTERELTTVAIIAFSIVCLGILSGILIALGIVP